LRRNSYPVSFVWMIVRLVSAQMVFMVSVVARETTVMPYLHVESRRQLYSI
jgi:hypothetical protein